MTDCSICCETFNKSKYSKISCPKCNLESCKNCVKTYLLSKADTPHCMGCKHGFDRKFCNNNLKSSWMQKQYKDHRKKILFDIEKARFPETMPYVEAMKSLPDLENKVKAIKLERDKIFTKLKDYSIEIKNLKITKEYGKHGEYLKNKKNKSINSRLLELKRLNNQLKEKNKEWYLKERSLDRKISSIKAGGLGDIDNIKGKKKVKKFIRACPSNKCKGFLSSAWKCGLCNIKVCKDCLEIKENDEHKCDENILKTAMMIKKETRNCPSCSAAIFKISGCDQMWCTQCQVAFSWKTGLKVTGTIHNPHFYEAQRNGLINVVQNPGAVACGGLPRYSFFQTKINNEFKKYNDCKKLVITDKTDIMKFKICIINSVFAKKEAYNDICKIEFSLINHNMDYITEHLISMFRGLNHFQGIELNPLRRKIQNAIDNKDLRIKYLLDKIDDKKMKIAIARRDKARDKNIHILNIYELFNTIVNEQLINIYNNCNIENIISSMNLIEKTREYCNKNLRELIPLFKNKVKLISGGGYFGYCYGNSVTIKKARVFKYKKYDNDYKISSSSYYYKHKVDFEAPHHFGPAVIYRSRYFNKNKKLQTFILKKLQLSKEIRLQNI